MIAKRRTKYGLRLLLMVGLLVAFGLRLHKLGDQNVWWDEGYSLWVARKGVVAATLHTATDTHPPLYYWLLAPWLRAAGETEFALRYLSVLLAQLTVALMVPLAQRLSGSQKVGIGAAWFLALSRFHIWWSQEIRMYVPAAFWALLSLYATARLASHDQAAKRLSTWAGWVLATAAAFATYYATLVVAVIENLFMLIVGLQRKQRLHFWGRWIGAQLVVALFLLPWLAFALPRMQSWSATQTPATLPFVFELHVVLLALGISTDVGQHLLPALLITAVGIAGVVGALRRGTRGPERWGALLLCLGLTLPPLFIWGLTQPRSFLYTPRVEARYLLPLAPLFSILLAWSIKGWHLWSRRLGNLVLLLLLLTSAWTLPQHYRSRYFRDTYSTLVRVIWAYARPDDVVLLVSGDRYPLFHTYYDRRPAPEARPPVTWMPNPPGEAPFDAAFVEKELAELSGAYRRIWLAQVESALQDPEGLTETWLMQHYARPLHFTFDYNSLSLFAPTAEEPTVPQWNLPPQHPISQTVTPGLTVRGYDLLTEEFRPGDTIRLGLYLEVEEATQVEITQVGADGRTVARHALTLDPHPGVVYRQARFRVWPYTPAQRYHFRLTERLSVGEVQVTHTRRPPRLTTVAHPLEARLGAHIWLLGYDLTGVGRGSPPTVRPGETLHLDLYWKAEAPVEERYKVFTHLIGTAHNPETGGPLWAQDDQIPLEGAYPTEAWLPNLPLQDHYRLSLPPHTPPGDYQLVVGMYTLEDGMRLPVSGEGAVAEQGYILLTPVRVLP
ncbi:MAG: glycosyltransferase family 39 protein [Anaerolineae bacterium]